MVSRPPDLPASFFAEVAALRQWGFDQVIQLWNDAYVVWQVDRPEGTWDTGAEPEGWQSIGSGVGRLYENGAGGDTSDGEVVYPESPYRMRLLASANLTSNHFLVVDETRLFKVDVFKVEDRDDRLANAYLSEKFGWTLPTEAP